MSTKREARLWKELRWRDLLLAGLITIILIAGYFYIARLETLSVTLQEFLLSIIANLIPTPLLFIVAYVLFNRLEELRSEKDADELADKVVEKLIAKVQTTTSGESNNFLDAPFQFSELYMRLSREFDVVVKAFEVKSNPQKLIVECTYRGENIIRIREISYSGKKLRVDDLSKTYTRTNSGMNALIQRGNDEIMSGGHYTIDLILATKWHKDTMESWLKNKDLGYLHFEIEHGEESVNLQKEIQ
jgi:hypothetical protein